MGTWFICMICNEMKNELLKDINFLWQDNLYRGKSVCSNCSLLVKHIIPNFNYVIHLKEKKKGLEKWL